LGIDRSFGMMEATNNKCNIWNVYRLGTLKTVAGELGKHRLDLVVVQEVRMREALNEERITFHQWKLT
jgi:hypothetical protein